MASVNVCPFQCRSGQCIQDREVCNGYSNCYDGSDELDSLCRGIDIKTIANDNLRSVNYYMLKNFKP